MGESIEAAPAGHVDEPADDLGQNHARVATRAHQRCAGDLARQPLAVGVLEARQRLDDGAYGQREVRPGVAVGDGIDVQVVDPAPARLGRGRRGFDEAADRGEIAATHADTFTASMCTSTVAISRPVIRPTS